MGYDPIDSEGNLCQELRIKLNFNLRLLHYILEKTF
jgi:hypothetical protein